MRRFSTLAVLGLFLFGLKTNAVTADVSWTMTKETDTYINDQTKVAFKRSIGGFTRKKAYTLERAKMPTFWYQGEHGVITVFFFNRGAQGCEKNINCAASFVRGLSGEMKENCGKYDYERSFSLKRAGSPPGDGRIFHFLADPTYEGRPAFSEVGAFEIGDFVFCYTAISWDRTGLADVVGFLRTFGVQKV